ncbi:MAG: acetolactate synthase large subunit [Rhodospirillales bacterium]
MSMNGAESLVRTLVASDVDVCFTNPGTSEMHFVAALDSVPGMRCVLGLFEGVVTGAADGYYRLADRPASTLLHLGPGLANGLANLHNAKKAKSGIVNVVGDHATYHLEHDAPLTSDIEAVAAPMSNWVKSSPKAEGIAADGALAVEAARTAPGQIATLILPADTAWNPGGSPVTAKPPAPRTTVSSDAVVAAAKVLSAAGDAGMLMLGGVALRERALDFAGRIAAKTGCRLLSEGQNARLQRGAGRVKVERVPYVVDLARNVLKDTQHMVLCGAKQPVAFFAYPNKPSILTADGCQITHLASAEDDLEGALEALAAELGCLNTEAAHIAPLARPEAPSGEITLDKIAAVLGATLPENAIVVDESVTSGRGFFPLTSHAPAHCWLNGMGGSIGYALPVSIGAAVAQPNRKVVTLEGDGSGMYTVQALWTMARENLDVTVVVFANRAYRILQGELTNVGVKNPGPRAVDMLSLDRPAIDWMNMAKSLGVEASRANDCDSLIRALRHGLASDGPYLIELEL